MTKIAASPRVWCITSATMLRSAAKARRRYAQASGTYPRTAREMLIAPSSPTPKVVSSAQRPTCAHSRPRAWAFSSLAQYPTQRWLSVVNSWSRNRKVIIARYAKRWPRRILPVCPANSRPRIGVLHDSSDVDIMLSIMNADGCPSTTG